MMFISLSYVVANFVNSRRFRWKIKLKS
jgi:hypothetical protein